jgi:hypothetical protein
MLGAAVVLASCSKDAFRYGSTKTGTLSFASMQLEVSEEVNPATKAEAAGDEYVISIYGSDSKLVSQKTWSQVRGTSSMQLPAGDYTMEVRSSSSNIPEAKFSSPVYGTSSSFSIKAGETTSIGSLICTLLQAVVTVSYNEAFLGTVTGDGKASVELQSGYPLDYALSYNEGDPKYEMRLGYFALNEDEATVSVTFKGSIEGKTQKMTATISGVKARDWHIITFMKKVDADGNASFSVEIDGLVEDIELDSDVAAEEEGDGNDPNAPVGDGDIELVSTCDYDITQPVVVPATGSFPLTMTAKIPNGARKFTVDIASDNADFIGSVNSVGGTTLDLINPSDAALGIFDIVPFPHGSELAGKTEIDFDLSGAQTPLLAFKGTHTFTMNVVDQKGCKKSIEISLKVE